MSTLVSWVAYDQRAPASAYIATDSRVTSTSDGHVWDSVRKCFASRQHPDIFGFVGDVQFPSLVLSQLVDSLDSGHLVESGANLEVRQKATVARLERALRERPKEWSLGEFTVLHVGRNSCELDSSFQSNIMKYSNGSLELMTKTSLDGGDVLKFGAADVRAMDRPEVEGAGAADFQAAHEAWSKSSEKHTSRAVFSALCSAIENGENPTVGGPPQLVGLYRKWGGQILGVVWNDSATVLGQVIDTHLSEPGDFRNSLFERVDQTGRLIEGAKEHLSINDTKRNRGRRSA